MAKLIWDATGERLYETGVDHCVLYPYDTENGYTPGVAWNGITAVNEAPSGAELTSLWADNTKYLNMVSAEEFGCTIEAYMYPDEFAVLDGSVEQVSGVFINQQSRGVFGLCYRTLLGNDEEGQAHGYKLHLVYGLQVQPSERNYQTVNDSPEAITFSWEAKSTPVTVTDLSPTSIIVIDSTKADAGCLAALEELLYGTDGTPGTSAELPDPDTVIETMTPAGP